MNLSATEYPRDPNLPGIFSALGNLFCVLSGAVFPFDAKTLGDLYASPEDYIDKINRSAIDLIAARFLLSEDAAKFLLPQTAG